MKKILQELESGNPEKALVILKHPVIFFFKRFLFNNGNLLNEAVINDYYDVVKRLFEIGANPNSEVYNKPFKHYKRNFFAAAFIPNPKILELFLKNEVDMNLEHMESDIFNVLSYQTNIENKFEKLKMLVKYKLSLERTYLFKPSQLFYFLKHKEQILSFWFMKRGLDFKGVVDSYEKTTLLMSILSFSYKIKYHSLPAIKYIIENSTNFSQKDGRGSSLFDIIEKVEVGTYTDRMFYIDNNYYNNKACVFVIAAIRRKKSYLNLTVS